MPNMDFFTPNPVTSREQLPANNYRNGISYWQALAVGIGQAFAVIATGEEAIYANIILKKGVVK